MAQNRIAILLAARSRVFFIIVDALFIIITNKIYEKSTQFKTKINPPRAQSPQAGFSQIYSVENVYTASSSAELYAFILCSVAKVNPFTLDCTAGIRCNSITVRPASVNSLNINA